MALTPTTWNPSDKDAAITLSDGDLRASYDGTANRALVRSIASLTFAAKFYFEATYTRTSSLDAITATGIGITSGTETGVGFGNSGNSGVCMRTDGAVRAAGSTIGTFTPLGTGNIYRFAMDFVPGGSSLIWATAGSGNWNGSPTADPATGVGGLSFTSNATSFVAAVGTTTSALRVFNWLANFGATAFGFAVPSGFQAGFPPETLSSEGSGMLLGTA